MGQKGTVLIYWIYRLAQMISTLLIYIHHGAPVRTRTRTATQIQVRTRRHTNTWHIFVTLGERKKKEILTSIWGCKLLIMRGLFRRHLAGRSSKDTRVRYNFFFVCIAWISFFFKLIVVCECHKAVACALCGGSPPPPPPIRTSYWQVYVEGL